MSFGTQEQSTCCDNGCRHNAKDNLGFDAGLNQRTSPGIPGHGAHIVGHATDETGERENPENNAQGMRKHFFERRRLMLQMEVDEDGDGDHGHVDSQAKPRQERPFVRAVVACV